MLRDFIAIDFETANQEPSSVCSVGVVMVRDGQIVDSFYSLIQPEPNYYNYWCQRVHGISESDTEDAPVAMICKTIIMPWPMPKPVQQSPYTYYDNGCKNEGVSNV